jgi:hypothetical protein
VPPRLSREDKGTPTEVLRNSCGSPPNLLALVWLWGGFRVALRWLWGGFGVAFGWLWGGFALACSTLTAPGFPKHESKALNELHRLHKLCGLNGLHAFTGRGRRREDGGWREAAEEDTNICGTGER